MYLELTSSPKQLHHIFIKIAVQIIEHRSETHKNDGSRIIYWPTENGEIGRGSQWRQFGCQI